MAKLENLPVSIRKTPDGTTYQIGVELYGAFQPFTFGGWPVGSFDAYLAEAKAAYDARQAERTNSTQQAQ